MLEIINTSVRQHNNFVSSPYATEFALHELKLVEYMIADCKKVDQEKINLRMHKSYTFTPTQLAKILKTSVSRIVADADKLANEITKKRIINKRYDINGEIVDFEYITIIPIAKYSNGQFRFDFNYEILSYFIDINKNFTEYQLHYLLEMRSSYAIKLYKLLYQYKTIKSRLFTIYELKEQFGILDKYSQYKNFKQKILDPVVKQINSLTDLVVNYNEIKHGRKIEKLEFTFDIQKTQKIKSQSKFYSQCENNSDTKECSNASQVLLHIESELSAKTKELVKTFYREKGVDYVEASIDYAKKNAKTNLDKYLNDTLVKGWAEVKVNKITDEKAKEHAKSLLIKQEHDKKQQEKEQDNLNKSMIENEWNKLIDTDKVYYTNYANFIISKCSKKLTSFTTVEQTLPLCIYAVSNQKFYDRMLESYVRNILNLSLNINDSLISK